MHLLLLADALELAAIADQTGRSDQAAIGSRHGRYCDRDANDLAGWSGVVGFELPALAAFAQHCIDFLSELPRCVSWPIGIDGNGGRVGGADCCTAKDILRAHPGGSIEAQNSLSRWIRLFHQSVDPENQHPGGEIGQYGLTEILCGAG